MAYQPIPTKSDGIITEVTTSDDDTRMLLQGMLDELKLINKYFSIVLETELTTEDV